MSKEVKISGVIITYNEEKNIQQCIESMIDVVDEIVVVDSFSNDKTQHICESLNVRFLQHPFAGHIEQKNYALDQASHDNVLALDADERLSDEMRQFIQQVKLDWNHDGYIFKRLNNYCGTWLKRSWYPDKKLRLWDRTKGRWGGTNPHDKVIMENGAAVKLMKMDILHYAYANLEEHYEQVKKFAIIAANSKYKKGKKVNFVVHVILNPWYKFVRKYFFRLGILDGYYGFIFSSLTAFLNFMKYLRLWELNRQDRRRKI